MSGIERPIDEIHARKWDGPLHMMISVILGCKHMQQDLHNLDL